MDDLWTFLKDQWREGTPLWALGGAILTVAGTKVLDRLERRRELRRLRASLAVLAFNEMALILADLRSNHSAAAGSRLLLFDVMVQRGGFEKLDPEVVQVMVEVFRRLEEVRFLDTQVQDRSHQDGMKDVGADARYRFEKRKTASDLIPAFLQLLLRREGRHLPRRTRRDMADRLVSGDVASLVPSVGDVAFPRS